MVLILFICMLINNKGPLAPTPAPSLLHPPFHTSSVSSIGLQPPPPFSSSSSSSPSFVHTAITQLSLTSCSSPSSSSLAFLLHLQPPIPPPSPTSLVSSLLPPPASWLLAPGSSSSSWLHFWMIWKKLRLQPQQQRQRQRRDSVYRDVSLNFSIQFSKQFQIFFFLPYSRTDLSVFDLKLRWC